MSRDFVAASSEGLDGTQSTAFNAQAYPVLFSAWFLFHIADAPYTFLEVRDVGAANIPRMQLTKTGDDNAQYFIKDTSASQVGVIGGAINSMAINIWFNVIGWSNDGSDHNIAVTTQGNSYGDIGTANGTTTVNWSAMDQSHIGYLGNFGGVNHFDGLIAEVGCWDGTIPDDSQRRGLANGYSPDNYLNGLRNYPPLMGISSPEPDLVSGDTFALVNTPTKGDHPRIIRPSNRSVFFVPVAAVAGTNRLLTINPPGLDGGFGTGLSL